MRQQHNNNNNNNNKNRSRGRNRKPGNNLSRNYESNGPDVKIRGNASHIADKYQNLARDALSNGDTVMAENYYQHAEHYNRIVAAAQQQQAATQPPQQQQNNQNAEGQAQNADAPQPEIKGTPAEVALGEGAERPVADDGEEAPAPRRNVRARRPRKTESEEAPAENAKAPEESAPAEVEEAPAAPKRNTRRRKPAVTEDVTEDAAMLPSSITGSSGSEEPVAVED